MAFRTNFRSPGGRLSDADRVHKLTTEGIPNRVPPMSPIKTMTDTVLG